MDRGGVESMLMNLYRCVDRSRVQFDFVENSTIPGAFDDEIRSLGGKIYYCPHFNGKNYPAYRRWWSGFWSVHKGAYPVVHGHIGSCAAIYLHAAKRAGAFTIAHSHSTYGAAGVGQTAYRAASFPTRFVADHFFACSRRAGLDRFGRRVAADRERMNILNNAIDTAQFAFRAEKRRLAREGLGYGEELFVIGHVGRFADVKNHSFLLDIFQCIHQRCGDARLLLVGDGELRKAMEEKAAALGLAHQICFTGVREDVADLMQAMDILTFPSKFEGLPVTLVEAQTSGLPCVISDRVPEDTVITTGLVKTLSLESPPSVWAEEILSLRGKQRRDHSREVTESGFDIHETARWLEEFYIERSRK